MTRDHLLGFPALASLIAQEQPRPARVTPQRIRLTAEQQAQRRALDVRPPAAPAAPADGWIEWGGGDRPVDGFVDVRFRCGGVVRQLAARGLWWLQCGNTGDIVAYRVAR